MLRWLNTSWLSIALFSYTCTTYATHLPCSPDPHGIPSNSRNCSPPTTTVNSIQQPPPLSNSHERRYKNVMNLEERRLLRQHIENAVREIYKR
ncbi:hypothetical protein [Mycoavidus sp. B2-EB]|uniref:hypothetical protein n=1 Tax=Mycoavidus sp. B2-EB TaxID=2651972 RepID=UPI0016251D23|nr:hypothetical protein [Mycoavidus sp. B2-EB]BBO59951.1 hypothetical protein MPB2EB_1082 [Mycoavidus sp. B2-EB]